MTEIRSVWERMPSNPDLGNHLGYDMLSLEVVCTKQDSPQYMFIPRDEDMIYEDAFLVASEGAICDPTEHV